MEREVQLDREVFEASQDVRVMKVVVTTQIQVSCLVGGICVAYIIASLNGIDSIKNSKELELIYSAADFPSNKIRTHEILP